VLPLPELVTSSRMQVRPLYLQLPLSTAVYSFHAYQAALTD